LAFLPILAVIRQKLPLFGQKLGRFLLDGTLVFGNKASGRIVLNQAILGHELTLLLNSANEGFANLDKLKTCLNSIRTSNLACLLL